MGADHPQRLLGMIERSFRNPFRGGSVEQLWELAASSPNMASLDRLWIDHLDNKAAPFLIKSPHLKESIRLCPDPSGKLDRAWLRRELDGSLNAANLKALRQRYPGTPF